MIYNKSEVYNKIYIIIIYNKPEIYNKTLSQKKKRAKFLIRRETKL